MKQRIALLALVVGLAAVACGDDDATTTTAATPTTAGSTPTTAGTTTTAGVPTSVNVSVSNFAFAPSSPTVALGGTVTFTVVTGGHTVTSATGAWSPSGAISEGGSFEVTLDAAGEYDFFCEFHPSMTGTLTVTG